MYQIPKQDLQQKGMNDYENNNCNTMNKKLFYIFSILPSWFLYQSWKAEKSSHKTTSSIMIVMMGLLLLPILWLQNKFKMYKEI